MAAVTAKTIRGVLRPLGDPRIASHSAGFFKSGPGEYGDGDQFLGIRVPVLRRQVKTFRTAPLSVVKTLLRSRYHEERLFAVLLLVDKYSRADDDQKQRVYDMYMNNREFVNNWDIVDSSAHLVVGPHLAEGDRAELYLLAQSDSMWDRRIAMMSTYHYIRDHDFRDALKIARILRDDEHDLIHKVVGWMLREIGNRDRAVEERFLRSNYMKMPRTMLRYSIEKFPESRRQAYLHGKV